jgi:hypothetical protein
MNGPTSHLAKPQGTTSRQVANDEENTFEP